MLIEMSELKDQLLSFNNMGNNNKSSNSSNSQTLQSYSNTNRSAHNTGEYFDTDLQPFMKNISKHANNNSSYSNINPNGYPNINATINTNASNDNSLNKKLLQSQMDEDLDPATSVTWMNRLSKKPPKKSKR